MNKYGAPYDPYADVTLTWDNERECFVSTTYKSITEIDCNETIRLKKYLPGNEYSSKKKVSMSDDTISKLREVISKEKKTYYMYKGRYMPDC